MIAFPISSKLLLPAEFVGRLVALCGLLAMPVVCLCGDPYPSAHDLLEFILAPQNIVMSADDMPEMALRGSTAHQPISSTGTPTAPNMTNTASSTGFGTQTGPAISGYSGHLEKVGSFSALAGLLLLLPIPSLSRRARHRATDWLGRQPQPPTPPPQFNRLFI